MGKKILIIGGSIGLSIVMILLFYKIFSNVNKSGSSGLKMPAQTARLSGASKALSRGDTEDAIKGINEIISNYPNSSEAEAGYFLLGSIYEKRGELLKAREMYQKIVEVFPGSDNVFKAQEALDNINIKLLFSTIITPDSFLYEVRKGDTLNKIAKNFNVTAELIAKTNGVKNSLIKTGQRFKISKAKFSVVVDKSQNILTLKSDGNILKTYRVSTGKDSSTPSGDFKITNKIVDPPWYPTGGGVVPAGDSKNVLGSRWMGISKPTYGIHGTIQPETIGSSVTEGCVRMKNDDVEELYTIVPKGTEVVIID